MSPSAENKHDQSRFELRTLLETSRLLIESQDPEFILNNLLLITMGKLMVTRGMILQYNPGEGSYLVSKAKGTVKHRENETIPFNPEQDITNKPVIYGQEFNLIFSHLNLDNNGILFNLKSNNYHLGFIYLGPGVNGKPFDKHEIDFVESLAIISAAAITSSRLFNEIKYINRRLDRKVHDLNTLLQLSKDFNLMVEPKEIIRSFKFAMLGQLLINTFFFALDDGQEKKIVSASGIPARPAADELEQLFSMQDIVHVYDNTPCSFLKNNNIKLLIGLRFQNKKLGVVGVGGGVHKSGFSDSDITFLQSLGNLALLAIQKTLLLKEQIEKQHMEEDLNLATKIQQGLLPAPLPAIKGFDIAAVNISSKQVGGDYYDVIKKPDNSHLVAIADVTGKGVPASLLMANLQSMLHALAPLDLDLSAATASINNIIHKNTPPDKFITFFWGRISEDGRNFKYVNAGHNPPFLVRKNEERITLLAEGGLILGALPTTAPYTISEIEIQPGDIITLFTDGVTETYNTETGRDYGEQRLYNCIRNNRKRKARQILNAVITDIDDFSGGVRHDDITLMILKAALKQDAGES